MDDWSKAIIALTDAGFTGGNLAWILVALMVAYRSPMIIKELGGVINQAVENKRVHQQTMKKLADACAAREKRQLAAPPLRRHHRAKP